MFLFFLFGLFCFLHCRAGYTNSLNSLSASLLSSSYWPINSGKKWRALMQSQAVVCMCVRGVEKGWTCRKHNQPDDKMSNHPTGFLDLLVWEIGGDEMTAWQGTSCILSICCFIFWLWNINLPFSLQALQTQGFSLPFTLILRLRDYINNIYLHCAA